jgi:hypothetical protein
MLMLKLSTHINDDYQRLSCGSVQALVIKLNELVTCDASSVSVNIKMNVQTMVHVYFFKQRNKNVLLCAHVV